MKRLIIAVSIVFWFSVAFGGDDIGTLSTGVLGPTGITSSGIDYIFVGECPNGIPNMKGYTKEEAIQYFIDSGDVCDVIGHHDWLTYDPCAFYEDGITYTFSDNNCHGIKTRTCQICGLKQKEVSRTEKVEVEKEVKEWINVE